MKISICGLSYVGTVCAGCLVSRGHTVIGVDVYARKLDLMNSCRVSIVEPEVPELFAAGQAQRRLSATTAAAEAMESAGLSGLRGNGEPSKRQRSMAMQKATVATPLSIDGLDLADGREVLLARDPHAFADKVVRLMADDEERRRLGANGLARVRSRYSWHAMGESLESALRNVVAPASRRSAGA